MIFFREMVGILLIIIKPIKIVVIKLRYSFLKRSISNSKNIKRGKSIKPAAAGDGTPVKYSFLSIGLFVM